MRVLHLTDRSSERGGADCHLRSVLLDLGRDCELFLAVGREDGSAAAPCDYAVISGLAATQAVPIGVDLDRVYQRFEPDLVHLHNVMNPRALAWAADRRALMTVQDHRAFCPGRGKLTSTGAPCPGPMSERRCAPCFDDRDYFERLLALTYDRLTEIKRLAAVTVLSSYMKEELVAVGLDAHRVRVIPPFVDGLDPEAAPTGPPCVLFAGRLTDAKGIDDAIYAWRCSGGDLPLVFAGTGPARGRLESEGHEVLGWIPHAELAGVYRRAAALLMPSRWQEPFGIVGLEAATLGVPVIAYDSGGVRDWHSGNAGLVPLGDVDALARALEVSLAREMPALVPKGFSRAIAMQQLRTLYEDLLER